MRERTNRVYVADFEEWGVICIAPSLKRAKEILWQDADIREYCEDRYIELRVSWRKDVEAGTFPEGIPDTIEALKAGFYTCINEDTCPECEYLGTIIYDAELGLVACENCVEIAQDEAEEEARQSAGCDALDGEEGE